jgi:hypothetical protein
MTEPWWLRGLIEQCSNTALLLAFGRRGFESGAQISNLEFRISNSRIPVVSGFGSLGFGVWGSEFGIRWMVSNPSNPQWVRIMVSPVKGALPVRVDSNRRLADRLRGPWLNSNIELWNVLVRSPRL